MSLQLVFDHDCSSKEKEEAKNQVKQGLKMHFEPLLSKMNNPNYKFVIRVSKLNKKLEIYRSKIYIHLPKKKVFVADASDERVDIALSVSFERIANGINRHLSQFQRRESYKRILRENKTRELEKALASIPVLKIRKGRDTLKTFIPKLKRRAQQELMHLQSVGILSSRYPTIDDVIDEAIAEYLAHNSVEPVEKKYTYKSLLQEVFKIIDREINLNNQKFDVISLNDMPLSEHHKQPEDVLDEVIYEYWQPDQVIQPEEFFEDTEGLSPEELQTEVEKQTRISQFVNELPILWRRSLLLHEVDGISIPHIAKSIGLSQDSVLENIKQSKKFIMAKLKEVGLLEDNGSYLFLKGGCHV